MTEQYARARLAYYQSIGELALVELFSLALRIILQAKEVRYVED